MAFVHEMFVGPAAPFIPFAGNVNAGTGFQFHAGRIAAVVVVGYFGGIDPVGFGDIVETFPFAGEHHLHVVDAADAVYRCIHHGCAAGAGGLRCAVGRGGHVRRFAAGAVVFVQFVAFDQVDQLAGIGRGSSVSGRLQAPRPAFIVRPVEVEQKSVAVVFFRVAQKFPVVVETFAYLPVTAEARFDGIPVGILVIVALVISGAVPRSSGSSKLE